MIDKLTTEQLIERGREALGRDAHPAALLYLREAARRHPDYADVHHLIGVCLSLLGEPGEALSAFDAAVEINPRYAEAQVNRALTLQELGRYDDARTAFQAASEADLEDGVGGFPAALAARLANGHKELGDLYAAGGALEEAAAQYRRALEIRPRFADIRNRLGWTLLEMGDHEAAVRELGGALEVNPNFVDARINLGLAWYRTGDLESAAREWELALEVDPDSNQARTYLQMLERTGG